MKKIIAVSFAVIFSILCVFSGCAKEQKQDNSKSSTQSTSETTTETTTPTVTEMKTDFGDYSRNKVIWGPGFTKDHKIPSDPASLEKQFSSLGGRWLTNQKKTICLTFDEGYENGFTPSILDTLKAKNVKAIFFVTYDFAKDNPKLIERMIKEGHIVGNHSYHHYTMDEVDLSVAENEITYMHKYMLKNFNYKMTLFRFPKGEFSQQTLYLAKTLGYTSVFWSFAYADWDTSAKTDQTKALQNITSSTHDGAIFLLHAVSETNAKILGSAIDDIKKQGYNFTTKI